MSDAFRAQTEKSIENTYSTFKQRVAEGRDLTENSVENIAQGRVWTGKQALEIGLVDSLGGLQETVEAAAKLVGIENYNLMEYPQFDENLGSLVSGMQISISLNNLLKVLLPNSVQTEIYPLKESNSAEYIQMLLPYELKIH
jgi:protease-4